MKHVGHKPQTVKNREYDNIFIATTVKLRFYVFVGTT